jgi:hypothetical protein
VVRTEEKRGVPMNDQNFTAVRLQCPEGVCDGDEFAVHRQLATYDRLVFKCLKCGYYFEYDWKTGEVHGLVVTKDETRN